MRINKQYNKRGFTLTELIIVIVIIGILATVLIPSLTRYIERARDAAASQDANQYAKALSTYNIEYSAGSYTDTFDKYCEELNLNVENLIVINVINQTINPSPVSMNIDAAMATGYNTDGFLLWAKYNRLVAYSHVEGTFDVVNLNKETVAIKDENQVIESGDLLVVNSLASFKQLKSLITILKTDNGIELNLDQLLAGQCINVSSVTTTQGLVYEYDSSLSGYRVIRDDSYENLTGALIIPSYYKETDGELAPVVGIGEDAFYDTEITDIYIPSSVKIVEDNAFGSMKNLTEVLIPSSVENWGESVFEACEGLKTVNFQDGVTTIGEMMFQYCYALESIEIPDSVTKIEAEAFYGCKGLLEVRIGKGVTEIGSIVFSGTIALTTIIIDKDNTVYDSRDNCNAIIETATNNLIVGCKNTVIPNTVTEIGYRAFFDCESLMQIQIPDSVQIINREAFTYTGIYYASANSSLIYI